MIASSDQKCRMMALEAVVDLFDMLPEECQSKSLNAANLPGYLDLAMKGTSDAKIEVISLVYKFLRSASKPLVISLLEPNLKVDLFKTSSWRFFWSS